MRKSELTREKQRLLWEDSLLLVATDINMPQGQEAILTTDEEVHYAREYLTVKKEQQQRIEEIE